MAVDKLVDSAQLDADLTAVANAIRAKGGTSAPLAFPAEFVSAIQAIPTGGGVQAATGEITILEDVESPSASGSNVFPGLRLDFQPDFLWLGKTKQSFIDTNASGIFCMCAIKKTMWPPYRYSSTVWSEPYNNDYIYYVGDGGAAPTYVDGEIDPSVPYGVGTISGLNQIPLTYNGTGTWSVNADGTFSYGRRTNTATSVLKAGSIFRYFAFKA